MKTAGDNISAVRQHYNSYFSLLDREKSLQAAGWQQRPPIVNLGYWADGARDARQAQERLVHELASRVPDWRDRRVLDAGCGLAGPATILACDYGARVDAININEQQLALARNYTEANGLRGRVRLHAASAMDLPFPDASFDVVFCLEAAHCFIDKRRFLAEVHRVLQPGGWFLFADITATTHLPLVRWQPALKLNLVTCADWQQMMEASALEVEEKRMIGSAVYPGCRRWVARTAAERRRAIFNRSGGPEAPLPVRGGKMLRAWILEFALFRSVLLCLSAVRLREYVLFVARKRTGGQHRRGAAAI